MRLLPREEKFYHFFNEQVGIISESAKLMLAGARAGNAKLAEAADRIAGLEQQGDEVIHELFKRLNQTFITPLDPEDLHKLGACLDDVLDGIEEAVHRMVAYRLEPIPEGVVEMCSIIQECAEYLTSAFMALSKDEKLLEHCIQINRLEDKADKVFRKAIADLFQTQTNAIELLKHKDIYEVLEDTADRCEDVADALQNVVVKNS